MFHERVCCRHAVVTLWERQTSDRAARTPMLNNKYVQVRTRACVTKKITFRDLLARVVPWKQCADRVSPHTQSDADRAKSAILRNASPCLLICISTPKYDAPRHSEGKNSRHGSRNLGFISRDGCRACLSHAYSYTLGLYVVLGRVV